MRQPHCHCRRYRSRWETRWPICLLRRHRCCHWLPIKNMEISLFIPDAGKLWWFTAYPRCARFTFIATASAAAATMSTSCASPSVVALFEHIRGRGIQHPVATLASTIVIIYGVLITRHLDKAIVQREIVPDGVLPALFVLTIVGKSARGINEII